MIALLAVLLAVVNAPYAPVSYACDGVTVAYTVNFPYLASSDLQVTSTTAGGAVTNLIITSDYLLSASSTTSTATLTLQAGSKCPNLSTLKIARQMSITQPTVLRQQTSFNPQVIEAIADRCVMQEQQIQAQFAGTQNVNFGGLNTWTTTQTFTPGAGFDAIVANASGSGGRAIVATASGSGPTIVATGSTGTVLDLTSGATSGVPAKFTTGNAVNGPIQITPQATDPSTPVNGEVWVNSTQGSVKARVGGATQQISGNPFLSATTAAGQSIANSTVTILVFGTVQLDTDSGYNSGTGRYTVPTGKGGQYFLTSSIMFANALTGVVNLTLYKNASGLRAIQFIAPGATQTITNTSMVSLVAGDVVDFRISQSSGGAQGLFADGSFNFMSIKRLSD